jgi:hypothetical protein
MQAASTLIDTNLTKNPITDTVRILIDLSQTDVLF